MKVVNAPAEPAEPSPDPSTEPVSVADALNAIEVATLDRLIALRQDQERLRGFRDKAKDKKDAVSDAVYQRVMDDYAHRAVALESKSAPLREQARAEYRKLKQITGDVMARRDQAQLAKDELEFRHEVGELTDAEVEDNLNGPLGILTQTAAEQIQIDALRDRFIEALGGADALEHEPDPPTREAPPMPLEDRPTSPASPSLRMAAALVAAKGPKAKAAAPPPAPPTIVPPPSPAPPVPPSASAAVAQPIAPPPPAPTMVPPAPTFVPPAPTFVPSAPAAPAPADAVPAPDDEYEGATVIVPRTDPRLAERIRAESRPAPPRIDPQEGVSTMRLPARPSAPPDQPGTDNPDDTNSAATMMLASAAIVLIEPASASQEYQLAQTNGVGRSDENQICLLHAGISRKHAVIKAVPGGFLIKDLGSQNGTFVNGQRVTEKALTDGDTIAIGSVRFVFRMPWSPTQSSTAGRSTARKH